MPESSDVKLFVPNGMSIPTYMAILGEGARRYYTEYCRYVYSVPMEGGIKELWRPARHHLLICDAIERILRGELKRLMVFMPPRHGKSMTITETLPSYFVGKNPDKRAIIVCYGDDFAVQFGGENRDKIERFGPRLFGVSVDNRHRSAKDWKIKSRRGGVLSSGTGGVLTGQGADLLIIDDPVKNRESADSKPQRESLYKEYQSTIDSRLQAGGAIIIVLTRWHEDDLAGRLLASENGAQWEVLSLPAIAESEGDLLGRKIGQSLWPEGGYDEEWAAQKKIDVGSYTWAALYQQRPAPLEGGLFKREWWQRYDQFDKDGRNIVPECPAVIISVDAAFKDKDENDFVSIQVWGKRNAFYYLIDKDKRHMDFPETLRAIREMDSKYPERRGIYIEDKANGSAVISVLHKEMPGVVPVEPKGGKEARAHAIAPTVESGNVFIPNNSWGDDLIEEAAAFPNGAHDDDVDAMTQALNQLIFHFADIEHHKKAVQWEDDMWEDYHRASESGQRHLTQKWGDPFGY